MYRSGSSPEAGPSDSTKSKNVDGVECIGSNSTDRGRNGTKLHTICDNNSITLGAILTGANTHDSTVVKELLESMVIKPPKRRKRNRNLLGDKAYDTKEIRTYLKQHGYNDTPVPAGAVFQKIKEIQQKTQNLLQRIKIKNMKTA